MSIVTRPAGAIRACTAFALIAMLLSLGGCGTNYKDFDAFVKTPKPVAGGKPYIIEPPDSLRLICPNAPELDNANVRLRPDGYVTLYLLGDVFAAGKSPEQFAAEIEEKLLKYYQDVTVQCQVTGYNSKVYYVAGETRAGSQPYTGRETVLDAILNAGIPRSSWPEKLIVMRPDGNGGVTKRMTINFQDMIRKGDLTNNAMLEEGDILYLPTNPFAAIGGHVRNLIAPVDPILNAAATPAKMSTIGVP